MTEGSIMDYGDRFRFENDGHDPREYELIDPKSLKPAQMRQFNASHGDFKPGACLLMRNEANGELAAITPEWLRGACGPGRWVPLAA